MDKVPPLSCDVIAVYSIMARLHQVIAEVQVQTLIVNTDIMGEFALRILGFKMFFVESDDRVASLVMLLMFQRIDLRLKIMVCKLIMFL